MSRDYPISASQLKKYKKCPEQYRLRYDSDHDPTKLGQGYRQLGGAVHKSIENILLDDTELRKQNTLEQKLIAEEKTLGYKYPPSMAKDVTKCLKNASKYIAVELSDEKILDVELDRIFPVNRPDLSHDFRAIMDVTTEDGIIDWKTGKKRPKDERVQAGVYLAAYSANYGRIPKYIKFVYLKNDKVKVSTHRQQDKNGKVFWNEEINEYWDEVIATSREILKSWETGEWPAKPAESKCYWCDWEGFCSSSPVGMGGKEWWKFY